MRSSYFVFYRHDAKTPLGGALRPAAPAKACRGRRPAVRGAACVRDRVDRPGRQPARRRPFSRRSVPHTGPRIPAGCVQRPSRRKKVSVKLGKCIQKCGLAIVEKVSPSDGARWESTQHLGKIRQRKPEIFGNSTKAFVKYSKKSNHFLPGVAFARPASGRCGAGAGKHICTSGSLILYHKNGF